jgi:hypothetical protein
MKAMKRLITITILSIFGISHSIAQTSVKTYFPTQNRFQNFNELRTLLINNKPLRLDPFEMFDIMTFKEVGSGFDIYLKFTISETGEDFYFNNIHNEFTYNGEFNSQYLWTGNQAVVNLKCAVDDSLVRVLNKKSKYKVIYCYTNDSEMARKPFPSESYSGYYIVDVIEIFDQFEREKE